MGDLDAVGPLSKILELGWKCARDAMFVADCATGLLKDMNPAAERLTGYARAELIGQHQRMLHPEAERAGVEEAFRAVTTGGPGLTAGFHLQRKDGSAVPVEITASERFEIEDRCLIIGVFRDISDMVDREQRLAVKRWALRAYAGAALALARARSAARLMQDICEAITRESLFVLAWVGFAEEGPGKPVRIAGSAGAALHYLDGLEASWDEHFISGQGPTGIALRTGTVQVLNDSEAEQHFSPWRERAQQAGIRSSLTTTFPLQEGRRGALMVYSSQPHAFGPVVTEAFTHLAEEIGVGLRTLAQAERLEAERQERERAQSELNEALASVVAAITTAMEMRDPYTSGHQDHVARLACAIAREMGWEKEAVDALRVAALVHDVGKISVSTQILLKPGKLNAEEWAQVKEHPDAGYAILKDVPFRWPIAEVVRQHHERLDGSGYPRGLKGDEILLGARIVAVADVVESLLADRPYRGSLGLEVALGEIERQAGVLLDAEVVRVCIALFREKGFTFAGYRCA